MDRYATSLLSFGDVAEVEGDREAGSLGFVLQRTGRRTLAENRTT